MRVSLPYSVLVSENSRLLQYLVKSHPAQYGAVWTRSVTFSSGLPTKWSNRSQSMPTKELAKIAKNQTVMVVCNP
jgi:hypothetical protein